MEYPSDTIEDLKLNAMHDALERARVALKEQSKHLAARDFSVRLYKPREERPTEGEHRLKYHCYAELNIKTSIVC
jgi:hypothetical protein